MLFAVVDCFLEYFLSNGTAKLHFGLLTPLKVYTRSKNIPRLDL